MGGGRGGVRRGGSGDGRWKGWGEAGGEGSGDGRWKGWGEAGGEVGMGGGRGGVRRGGMGGGRGGVRRGRGNDCHTNTCSTLTRHFNLLHCSALMALSYWTWRRCSDRDCGGHALQSFLSLPSGSQPFSRAPIRSRLKPNSASSLPSNLNTCTQLCSAGSRQAGDRRHLWKLQRANWSLPCRRMGSVG